MYSKHLIRIIFFSFNNNSTMMDFKSCPKEWTEQDSNLQPPA